MKFSKLYDVFSRRSKEVEPFIYQVPITLRIKVFHFCKDVFSNTSSYFGNDDQTNTFWNEIHEALLRLYGRFQLVENSSPESPPEDAVNFLLNCRDEQFLDFIELIFKVDCLFHVQMDVNLIVSELNELFISEDVGYEITKMVKETIVEPVNDYPFRGREYPVTKTISYPQVIRKDNKVIHNMVIKPALQLLSNSKYKTANQEYMEALEDYKTGDYGDCLTKCCSAFESTMKIICVSKKWSYDNSDTASTLVKIIVEKAKLGAYFEPQLTFIATLRNKLSKSHGAGTQPKTVSQNLARYALDSTASAIILLVDEIS